MIDRMLYKIGEDVIYKTYVDKTEGNKALGEEPIKNYTSEAIRAIVKELNIEVIKLSGGTYKIGDIEVKIKNKPTYQDLIVYEGKSYRVHEILPEKVKNQILYKVRCKRL